MASPRESKRQKTRARRNRRTWRDVLLLITPAVLAGLPVVAAYLAFQRRVTEGLMATAGLKRRA